jgi:hypothetical protein
VTTEHHIEENSQGFASEKVALEDQPTFVALF